MEVSIAAEALFYIGTFPVTNSLVMTLVASGLLLLGALLLQRKPKIVPKAVSVQHFAEVLVEGLQVMIAGIVEDKAVAQKVFPLIATLFLFILLSNWLGLLPGMGTVGLRHDAGIIPFIRSGAADLNTTIALSMVAVFSVQFLGIASIGVVKYGKKFFVSPFRKPYGVGTFVGLLELLSEVTRMISFSFRLFGNVFAGEVLLVVMLHLVPYVVPVPFLVIEVFVGLVQAMVFSLLTLVFVKMAVMEAEH
jgi:F-type H+-transporting ATPase subunit a